MDDPRNFDEHAWVRSRLVARLAGLLEGEQELRFDSHVAGCAACADAWRRYVGSESGGEPEAAPDGHLPPDLIAAWPRAADALVGLERRLVAEHLARCADCRADLELLGHRPVLAADAGVGEPDNIVPLPVRPCTTGERGWRTWLGWSWGAVATAAALALWLIPAGQTDSPVGGAVPWVTASSVRGDGPDSVLRIDPGTSRVLVVLRVPALLPIDEALTVRILGPDGEQLQETLVAPDRLAGRTLMIELVGPGPLAAGAYRVVFLDAAARPLAAGAIESAFSLEIAAD